MKSSTIATIAAILGGILLLVDIPTPTPEPIDTLAECYAADRASKRTIISAMSGMEFSDDEAQAKYWNDAVDAMRVKDYQPFIDMVAEAIEGGTLRQLAESL